MKANLANFVPVNTSYWFPQNMLNSLTEKTKTTLVVEIIEFVPEGDSFRTTIKKQTGTVKTKQIAPEKDLKEKTSPNDIYAQVVEGGAKLAFDDKEHTLDSGHGLMIPAGHPYSISSDSKFKMILTIVKNAD